MELDLDMQFFSHIDVILQFIWHSKEQRLIVPHWRNQRPYIMAQTVLVSFYFVFTKIDFT